jgi:hypothetical protein
MDMHTDSINTAGHHDHRMTTDRKQDYRKPDPDKKAPESLRPQRQAQRWFKQGTRNRTQTHIGKKHPTDPDNDGQYMYDDSDGHVL